MLWYYDTVNHVVYYNEGLRGGAAGAARQRGACVVDFKVTVVAWHDWNTARCVSVDDVVGSNLRRAVCCVCSCYMSEAVLCELCALLICVPTMGDCQMPKLFDTFCCVWHKTLILDKTHCMVGNEKAGRVKCVRSNEKRSWQLARFPLANHLFRLYFLFAFSILKKLHKTHRKGSN